AQAIVDTQRLRDVAAPLECLHQDPVSALAVRGELDQPAPALLRLGQGRAAEAESRLREALEPAQADILESPPPVLEPRLVLTLEQSAAGNVIGDARRTPGLRPLAVGDVGFRAVRGLEGRLHVDESVWWQDQLDLRSSNQPFRSDDAPQLRDQDVEAR